MRKQILAEAKSTHDLKQKSDEYVECDVIYPNSSY